VDTAFTGEDYERNRDKGFTDKDKDKEHTTFKEKLHAAKEKLTGHKDKDKDTVGDKARGDAADLNEHVKGLKEEQQEMHRKEKERDVMGYAPKGSTLPYCDHKHCFEFSPCPVHGIASSVDRRDLQTTDASKDLQTDTHDRGTWKDKAKHVKDVIAEKITGKGHRSDATKDVRDDALRDDADANLPNRTVLQPRE
jgi:hypothetical protein